MRDSTHTPVKKWQALASGPLDIIALSTILLLALIGLFFDNDLFLRVSLVAAIFNFSFIWYWLGKTRDERVKHHVYLSSYVALLVTFIVLATVGSFHRHGIIERLDHDLYTRIIAWFIAFAYALTYSIVKRTN